MCKRMYKKHKLEKPQTAKTILKKNKIKGLKLPNFKTYYKELVYEVQY